MIEIEKYRLNLEEEMEIKRLLKPYKFNPSLEEMWKIIDQVWTEIGCVNYAFNSELYNKFYSHPVWILNGIFIEHHDLSLQHRHSIANCILGFNPLKVIDYGGGFGTLGRLVASHNNKINIDIFEPYPCRYAIESCQVFTNITFMDKLKPQEYDVLVSTDVLEHVHDPISLLVKMIDSVRVDGYLIIANCFYPVIACHIPSTFHLRYTFNHFCQVLGIEVIGACVGSHATIFQRKQLIEPDWIQLRQLEEKSRREFPYRDFKARYLNPWYYRLHVALTRPLHYPRKIFKFLTIPRS